ncbi:hypothetical protein NDU88_006565 [Pleurodeles waltl]|uniref:Uncharacterized protein n=1 Tax=Pleurodeles waltl TaxID=8319 RepID=A0AAV7PLE8_PLEWA|nr:hypothetical protein NDU88_006565 [Pleurodeles waltl]
MVHLLALKRWIDLLECHAQEHPVGGRGWVANSYPAYETELGELSLKTGLFGSGVRRHRRKENYCKPQATLQFNVRRLLTDSYRPILHWRYRKVPQAGLQALLFLGSEPPHLEPQAYRGVISPTRRSVPGPGYP